MIKFSERFEKLISMILLAFAMLIIVYQVIELFWSTIQSFLAKFRENNGFAYAPEYTRSVAVVFFNILLMMEIMQTIKVFAHSQLNKMRIILIVCVIAVSRKILALGEQTVDPMGELALAALILSLTASYFLVSRYLKKPVKDNNEMGEIM
jgi:uncharacterized membrane protein (DUF373 family)